MKASEREVAAAVDRGAAGQRLILLHGSDEGLSAELAARLGRALGADAERIDLDGPTLKAAPGRLVDEAAALGLFGGARWVRVQGGDECFAALEGLLAAGGETAPVVMLAGELKPASPVLKLALARPDVLALQSWRLSGERLDALVRTLGREHGLQIEPPLDRKLADATRGERALIVGECEKLALFLDAAPDRPRKLTADVLDQLSADASEASLWDLVDAVFDGKPKAVAHGLTELGEAHLVPALRLASRRALLLAGLRSAVERGRAPGQVVATDARWLRGREQAAVERQLGRWSATALRKAATRVFEAEAAFKTSSPGPLAAAHALLTLSRAAAR